MLLMYNDYINKQTNGANMIDIDTEIQSRMNALNIELIDEVLLSINLDIMDAILSKKLEEGKIVFSEVEDGLLN